MRISEFYFFLKKRIEYLQGVDFIESVSCVNARIDSPYANRYDISNVRVLKKCLKACKINENDSFFDYGCGKGAVLYVASKFPFRKIAGIELSKPLAEVAKNNMHKLKQDNVEIICGDARYFTLIDEYNYFYFFNPFSEIVFEDVMKNIKESYSRKPRKIIIIYYNPVCHDSIINTGIFKQVEVVSSKAMCASMYLYTTI